MDKTMATASVTKKFNRLSSEKSPYLLQHAENPVDWYPWGSEAFQKAKDENKLIFLSVGYSTCHWCHVMERESFENENIAKIMNENFINIKVDREERPDVDKVYMTFVTASSGRGGWPMSVFLTPSLVPVAGGTYYPPSDQYGRVGFPTVLTRLASKWKDNKEAFQESGTKIMEVLDRTSRLPAPGHSTLPGQESIARCFYQLSQSYEAQYGGFSESPKFPQPSNFNFLFTYYALNSSMNDAKIALDMALHTLTMMNQGGIHDHVAQGFARYSTDQRWHVPHFEKMLYDQAQLTHSYLDAYLSTGDSSYATVVRDILTYVCRDLSHPNGGFYSAEDADSLPTPNALKKCEGAFCVWTQEEINALLGELVHDGTEVTLSDVFCHHFSVIEGGNVNPMQDPHDELKNQNVLIAHGTAEETATEFGLTRAEVDDALQRAKSILFEVRNTRPRPHLDDKMITSWNGMMFGAMARAGAALKEDFYLQRALKAATFIRSDLLVNAKLLRAAYADADGTCNVGSSIDGFADDYAWVIRGLTHLYEATLDVQWLEWAEELQDKQNELFWDADGTGYFMTQGGDDSILLRIKEDQDGAEPSANSISAGNLWRLANLLDRSDYRSKADDVYKLFSDRLEKIPIALPEMVTAMMLHNSSPVQIILASHKKSESLQCLLNTVHSSFLPNKVILLADENLDSLLYTRHPSLKNYSPKSSSEATAYVCSNFKCSLPVTTSDQLRECLKSPFSISSD